MSQTAMQYESRTKPAPIWPSPLWLLVGIILPLVAGPGFALHCAALSSLPWPNWLGMGNSTVHGIIDWIASGFGLASVALPILMFIRGIILTVNRRSPLGFGLGIGMLIGVGIDLVLAIGILWYLLRNPPFYPG